jgi:putative RNA 2'-phosphotransferase
MNEKQVTTISKFLSLVLRHQPECINLTLDEQGWADVSTLIQKCATKGHHFNFDDLNYVVETNSKKRFKFNEDFTKIRASQGHSIEVDLGYQPKEPPEFLYHGTGEQSIESIKKKGLEKRNRQHIHLSIDMETAIKVGQRHGKPFVFSISSGDMNKKGFKFYLSDNGVWLTDYVPVEFINFK